MKISISFLSAMVFARSAHSEPLFEAGATGTNPSNKAGKEGKEGKKLRKPENDQCEDSYSSDGFIGKFPTKDRRKELEKRFGKIFKNRKALDKKFCVIADHLIASFGAVSLTTTLNSTIGERFRRDPSESEDEFKLICMAACMEDPICDYAEVSGAAATERGIACTLFTGDESRGGPVYTQQAYQGHAAAKDYTATVLVKKGTDAGAPLEFEGADGPLCDVDLKTFTPTLDLSNYIEPAVTCLGGPASFQECSDCIGTTIYLTGLSGCRSLCLDSAELLCGSTDAESIISQNCTETCKANTCLAKVQKASLCALGSYASQDSVGCVNRRYDNITDAFTCPVDIVN